MHTWNEIDRMPSYIFIPPHLRERVYEGWHSYKNDRGVVYGGTLVVISKNKMRKMLCEFLSWIINGVGGET